MASAMIWILRVLLGGVFVVAGAMKAWDPSAFQVNIDGYHLVPTFGSAVIAVYLPWLEIFAGLLLMSGRLAWRAGLAIIIGLTVLFIAALVQALARGLNPDCGCMGALGSVAQGTLVRDLALLIVAALIWWRHDHVTRPNCSDTVPMHRTAEALT